MDPITVAYIGMGIMLAMIAMGVPIAFAMTAVGAAGTWVLVGPGAMFTQLQMNAVQKGMQFTMVALPMFILMGQLVYHARIAEDLYDCVQKWFGRIDRKSTRLNSSH